MKKIISILVISLMFLSQAKAKGDENNWAEMKLKGKVKSVKETEYKTAEKTVSHQKETLTAKRIIVFNEKGNKKIGRAHV